MTKKQSNDFDYFLGDSTPERNHKQLNNLSHNSSTVGKQEVKITHDKKKPTEMSDNMELSSPRRTDITIKRKRNALSIINSRQPVPSKGKDKIDKVEEGDHDHDHDSSSSSLADEREDNLLKVQTVKKIGAKNNSKDGSISAGLDSGNVGAGGSLAKAEQHFSNHKKITSLDEFYVESNYFKRNSKDPFKDHQMDFENKGVVVEMVEARYLPDTANFVKVRGFFYSNEGHNLTEPMENVARMDGDLNQQTFDLILKLEKIKAGAYDDVYLFLVWETFQDIFGDDDIEFTPLVFGFSLVKLFNTDGLKSLSTVVQWYNRQKWFVARGLFQIGIYPPNYLKLERQELIRIHR